MGVKDVSHFLIPFYHLVKFACKKIYLIFPASFDGVEVCNVFFGFRWL